MPAILLPIALVAVFLVFRANPQRRRVMSQQSLHSQLVAGEKVVTAGGMLGTIVAVEGDRAAVEIAPDVVVEFLLAGILRRAEEPVGQDGGAAHEDDPVVPDDDGPPAPHHEES
jgi:preprotein translocase subunit YajC